MSTTSSSQDPVAGSIKTLTARCYCKAVHFTLAVPNSSLPLKRRLCHCGTCRATHGTLCSFQAPLPSGVGPCFVGPSSLSSLTPYRLRGSNWTRYFCGTCGCHVGAQDDAGGCWTLSPSIFDANAHDVPAVWGVVEHFNTDSAPGGGLYSWLTRIGGKEVAVVSSGDPEHTTTAPPDLDAGSAGSEELKARCHCGGVSFTISRPDPDVASFRDWISPTEPTKWLAAADSCRDCRLQSGAHLTGWAFIPQSRISPGVPQDLTLGTSKPYRSSEQVLRSFCGVCGAKVLALYTGPERALVDGDRLFNVAVGLLRAPEGVLAERWLTWRTVKVGFAESGRRYDAAVVEALEEGLERWGEQNGGKGRVLELYP